MCEICMPKKDRAMKASIQRGLEQSAAGETVDLGDFSQYLDDEPEVLQDCG